MHYYDRSLLQCIVHKLFLPKVIGRAYKITVGQIGLSAITKLFPAKQYLHHRLRSSASPVVKVTSHFNGKL